MCLSVKHSGLYGTRYFLTQQCNNALL